VILKGVVSETCIYMIYSMLIIIIILCVLNLLTNVFKYQTAYWLMAGLLGVCLFLMIFANGYNLRTFYLQNANKDLNEVCNMRQRDMHMDTLKTKGWCYNKYLP
jgi:hypothetical protein